MSLTDVEPTIEQLLGLLHAALVDIRESNDLHLSNRLADIFHDLPAHLIKPAEESDLKYALEQIIQRSHAHGLESYLSDLWSSYSAN